MISYINQKCYHSIIFIPLISKDTVFPHLHNGKVVLISRTQRQTKCWRGRYSLSTHRITRGDKEKVGSSQRRQ